MQMIGARFDKHETVLCLVENSEGLLHSTGSGFAMLGCIIHNIHIRYTCHTLSCAEQCRSIEMICNLYMILVFTCIF